LGKRGGTQHHRPHPINHPVTTTTTTAQILVEYQSTVSYNANATPVSNTIGFTFNGQDYPDTIFNPQAIDLYKRFNTNIVYTATHTQLQHGTNNVLFRKYADNTGKRSRLLMNRITVDYWQHLRASNQEMLFNATSNGSSTFQVQGFTVPANQALVWDISNPRQPVQVTGAQVNSNLLSFGQAHTNNSRYLATTTSNIRTVKALSTYTPPDLQPACRGMPIGSPSAPPFLTETERLAAHRASYSNLVTHVLLVDDLFNQYAYGFPLPEAGQRYIREAQVEWSTPPRYLLLVGDADINPRLLECGICLMGPNANMNFAKKNPEQMPPFYTFDDAYQGMVPTDHPYAKLTDDNLYPSIAVGRLSVETEALADFPVMGNHIENVVDKIILYEENLLEKYEWQRRMLFLYDDADRGGILS
jgi:hypothetical protein